MSGAKTSASKSLRLLLFRSKLLRELKWNRFFQREKREVVKTFFEKQINEREKYQRSSCCCSLPQTDKALRVQIANVVAEQQQLLQPSHLDEELLGNFLKRVLTQMQLDDLGKAAKGVRVDALYFVGSQIEDNEIPQIPQMLLVDVSYEVLLQVKALEMH